ncbi:MAG: hypothetical protein A2Y34_06030 [Spirochaetes bacterium GWC1_27_15]|nr:MAG: hypothetical protein A2Z98_17215 [Spirochaetes bacterium GWB1_27_13]OHD22344.1 MAG: hypothetical protein A2Y34_06030 [Spirochaetes bacterium GWC1_27_15]
MNIKDFFKKHNITLYTILILIIGITFFSFIIIYLINNYFRLANLIVKYKFELIFLLITGYFLYSFKYDFFSMRISFNSFIIYISNNILKEHHYKGIELIFFFIIVYFLSQFFIGLLTKGLNTEKIEKFFMRIVMWTILILVFNFLISLLKINITNLSVKDILLIILLFIPHSIVKILFSYFEALLKGKYIDFLNKYLTYLIIDCIIIFFSILVGNVYSKIGILNTAFFIAFLAIVISLIRYISNYTFGLVSYFSINSFINPNFLYKDYKIPQIFLGKKIEINNLIDKSIKYFAFVTISSKNDNFTREFLENLPKDYKFYLINNTLTTIIPLENLSIENITNLKNLTTDCFYGYCIIERKYFENIDIIYIFRSILNISKKIKSESDIVEIKQNLIF